MILSILLIGCNFRKDDTNENVTWNLYNGYYAVTLGSDLMHATVIVEECIGNVRFIYPYPGAWIVLINENKMYRLTKAYEQNIITLDDIYEIYS